MSEAIGKVGVVGLGLIGGSLALALKSKGIEVIAYDKAQIACQKGERCVTGIANSIAEIADCCDVIVLSVPIQGMASILSELKGCRKVITDVSSIKQAIIETVERAWGEVPPNFVPGHPIAGKEQTGNDYAEADLFEQHRIILCPLDNTAESALRRVAQMWKCAGAIVNYMDCLHHDKVLALTSHLPHLLAYALVHYLCENEDKEEIARYSAGGFRDFTRIAESDSAMWQSISARNRKNILFALDGFKESLDQLSTALRQEDDEAVLKFFSNASLFKKQLKKICG